MPLFYFDVYDGLSGLDRVGEECADHDMAFCVAARRADKLMADQADWFRTGQGWQIGVTNAHGEPVFNFDFGSCTGAAIVIQVAARPAASSRANR